MRWSERAARRMATASSNCRTRLRAAGIVKGHHEVGPGDRRQPPADDLPRDEQVTQADYGEVEHQRRTQDGGSRASRRNAGDNLDRYTKSFRPRPTRRPVRPCRRCPHRPRDLRPPPRRMRPGSVPAGMLDFVRHAGRHQLLAREQVGNRIQIGRVTGDNSALGNHLDRSVRCSRFPGPMPTTYNFPSKICSPHRTKADVRRNSENRQPTDTIPYSLGYGNRALPATGGLEDEVSATQAGSVHLRASVRRGSPFYLDGWRPVHNHFP